MFKKIILSIIAVILVLLVVIAVGKNIIAKEAITKGVKAITGLTLEIKKMNIGFASTLIGIEGLQLFNPDDFEDRIMVDLPEIYVDYDLKAFLDKKIHLEEVRLKLNEFVVVTRADGTRNIDALNAAPAKDEKKPKKEAAPKEQGKAPEFKIDVLQLKVGKVVLVEYDRKGKRSVKEINVNIDERFENIDDPQKFVRLIVTKTLMKTALDVGNWKDGVSGLLKDSTGVVTGTAGDVVDQAKDKLKKLLPF
ncbi:MAG: AsmA family protein [Candidatus Omnitrophota bacterium]